MCTPCPGRPFSQKKNFIFEKWEEKGVEDFLLLPWTSFDMHFLFRSYLIIIYSRFFRHWIKLKWFFFLFIFPRTIIIMDARAEYFTVRGVIRLNFLLKLQKRSPTSIIEPVVIVMVRQFILRARPMLDLKVGKITVNSVLVFLIYFWTKE